MTVLTEDPTLILVVGTLAEAALAVVLLRTGRGVVLWVMLGLAALMLGAVGLERMIVTERERVEATLEAAVAAVAANDPQSVLEHVDPSAKKTQSLVRWAFNLVEFNQAKITHLEITVNDLSSPPRAEARLTGIVSFKHRTGGDVRGSYPVEFVVRLRRLPDRWVIVSHEWSNDPYGK